LPSYTIARGGYYRFMAELGSGYEDREQASFFSLLPTPPALLGGLELLSEASVLAARLGDDAQAIAIDGIIGSVERNVGEIGVETVKVADRAIIDRIRITRVRPDAGSLGAVRPKRLEEGIHSEVLGLGAVGIASIDELETVVGTDGRPFWRAQEYGSTHNVGRVVIGIFQPGGAMPDQQDFRKHPIFQVGGEGAGAMHIQRPIPARHFLRDGAAMGALYRERAFRDAEIGAITDIKAVRASLV
jgi:hypothetical protein